MKTMTETKVNVMKLQSVLNDALKAEQKSLTAVLNIVKDFKDRQEMKDYLNATNLTFDQVTNYEYFKGGLIIKTFEVNGKKFEHIARKDYKSGAYVMAKWSFWLILNAARKVRKEELKASQKAAKEAKEKSLEAIEAEEKKAGKAAKGSKAKEGK